MDINSPTSSRSLNSSEKKAMALELRKSGATFKQIAERIGCSIKMATNYVNKSIEEVTQSNRSTTQQIIDLEVARLDAMLLAIAPNVNTGHLGSVDRAIKIMERRSKLLGLDKPVKIAPTTPEGDEAYTPDNVRNKVIELINRADAE